MTARIVTHGSCEYRITAVPLDDGNWTTQIVCIDRHSVCARPTRLDSNVAVESEEKALWVGETLAASMGTRAPLSAP